MIVTPERNVGALSLATAPPAVEVDGVRAGDGSLNRPKIQSPTRTPRSSSVTLTLGKLFH
jgi:hypothetical protein